MALMLASSVAGADPKVAFQETGEGFRIGQKIRVLDLADGSIGRFNDDWVRESSPYRGPDGSELAGAASRDGGVEDIFVSRRDRPRRWLTDHPAPDMDPVWSPDGSRIAFVSLRDGPAELYVVDADGTDLERVTEDPWDSLAPSWAPNGARLVYRSRWDDGDTALRVLHLLSGRDSVLKDDERRLGAPQWSPNGRYVAYETYDMGIDQLHVEVMTLDGLEQWRPTAGIGPHSTSPAWTPDGRISFATGSVTTRDIAVTDLRGGAVEMLTDRPTMKDGIAWYDPRYFAVRAQEDLLAKTWGWLKRPD